MVVTWAGPPPAAHALVSIGTSGLRIEGVIVRRP